VFIGDFNTDSRYPKSRCGDYIDKMTNAGWQHAKPSSGASYWSLRGNACCIDHAFVSIHFSVLGADYINESQNFAYAGKTKKALSDHAVLVVDVLQSGDD